MYERRQIFALPICQKRTKTCPPQSTRLTAYETACCVAIKAEQDRKGETRSILSIEGKSRPPGFNRVRVAFCKLDCLHRAQRQGYSSVYISGCALVS